MQLYCFLVLTVCLHGAPTSFLDFLQPRGGGRTFWDRRMERFCQLMLNFLKNVWNVYSGGQGEPSRVIIIDYQGTNKNKKYFNNFEKKLFLDKKIFLCLNTSYATKDRLTKISFLYYKLFLRMQQFALNPAYLKTFLVI